MSGLSADPERAAIAEVERLHAFLAAWFQGRVATDRFEPDFAGHLHPEFENIQPAGTVLPKQVILDQIEAAHGSNPDFEIAIEEPRLLAAYPEAGLIHATYVEAQTGAKNSARENRRRSTALFEIAGDRLLWRHLQETGLPR
ncbi:MAG: hypothetical protein AAF713_04090 [Pseudomonadota bacterium]